MTDPTTTPEAGEVTPEDAHVSLLDRAGHFGTAGLPTVPGFRPLPTADALRALADAPKKEVPNSARISLLYELARQGFPDRESAEEEYRALARSVAGDRALDPDEFLKDLADGSTGRASFRETRTGQALNPEEIGFTGVSVCTVKKVQVGDLTGTWIYSEFDTDAPFEHVSAWVDPHNWPHLAPLMFKRMKVVGASRPLAISGEGTDHWHGLFHEEVQLVRRINTLLHCDHWKDGNRAAGMTYELAFSADGQLDIDRGFITVNAIQQEGGQPACRVQALKIVGFTEDIWDEVADRVCPWWTDFLVGAVQGSKSLPKPVEPATPPEGIEVEDLIAAWSAFFGTSAKAYLDLFDDVNTRAASGAYSPSDWLADGSRFWSRLARDWVRAWTYGLEKLPELTRDTGVAGVDLRPPVSTPTTPTTPTSGRAAAAASTSAAGPRRPSSAPTARGLDDLVIAVPGLAEDDRPVTSDLVSIEARPATIAARNVVVTVEKLPDGTRGVRLRTSDVAAPPGLYVGTLLRTEGGESLFPVQLYVSGALQS